MSEHFFRMRQIFAGADTHRSTGFYLNGKKLVHYTTAANAVNILRSEEMWLRNVRAMNDLQEVHHGFGLLEAALAPPADSTLEKGLVALNHAIDEIFPGLSQEATSLFNSYGYNLRHQTFVACLSEHDPIEDEFGRLSMWRSYTANQVGVAIVINPQPFQQLVSKFGVTASPVQYLKQGPLKERVLSVAANVRGAGDYLRCVQREEARAWYFYLLRSIATCSKHPGFKEEQEWRIMHTRGIDETFPLKEAVETLGSLPQVVMKLPLKDYPENGVFGLTLPSLIEKVIVGPCQYPWVVCDALLLEMQKVNIPSPQSKIVVSEIPLRT